jgi:hypothetical protein
MQSPIRLRQGGKHQIFFTRSQWNAVSGTGRDCHSSAACPAARRAADAQKRVPTIQSLYLRAPTDLFHRDSPLRLRRGERCFAPTSLVNDPVVSRETPANPARKYVPVDCLHTRLCCQNYHKIQCLRNNILTHICILICYYKSDLQMLYFNYLFTFCITKFDFINNQVRHFFCDTTIA